MILSPLLDSLISLIDLSRPAVMGITTPGKRTVFLKGKIGSVSGRFSFSIASSSSIDISGINSASSFKSSKDNLSNDFIFFRSIILFKTLCHSLNEHIVRFLLFSDNEVILKSSQRLPLYNSRVVPLSKVSQNYF